MGVLTRGLALGLVLAAMVVTGCYSPAIRDCTVSCAAPSDCASGQVCGADGLCAAPGVAGRCGAVMPDAAPGYDAAPGNDAAPPHDAGGSDAASPDAAVTVSLHVVISGTGSVVIAGVGTCSSQDAQHGDCTYEVALGVARTAHAVQVQQDQVFSRWQSLTCAGQGETCTFTPVVPTSIIARFDRGMGRGDLR